jgi:succinoglycan biosynthesis protein ExoM
MLLARCLASLATQIVADDIAVSLVVVDNDPAASARLTVARFCATAPFPTYYVHEPIRGIARARNAALDKAAELGADWIAMLDDDEVADPRWLANLMAPEYLDTPVVMGAHVFVYPVPRPFWAPEDEDVKGEEGQRLKTAYTNNVRFSARLLRAGLRFDEGLRFMGGEDNEFFAAAQASGFAIRRTLRAITLEAAHPERLSYRGIVYRTYWCAASDMRKTALMRGWRGAALRKAHTIPLNIAFGVAWLLTSVPAWAFGRAAFKHCALGGGKKLAKAAGRAAALLGVMPQPYRTIHGS